jgi:hypothetical protein
MSLQSPTICTRCGDLSENPDGWRSNATRVLVEELKYTSPGVGGGHPPSIVDLSTLVALEFADFDVTCLVTVRLLVCNQLLCQPPFSLFIGTNCGLFGLQRTLRVQQLLDMRRASKALGALRVAHRDFLGNLILSCLRRLAPRSFPSRPMHECPRILSALHCI